MLITRAGDCTGRLLIYIRLNNGELRIHIELLMSKVVTWFCCDCDYVILIWSTIGSVLNHQLAPLQSARMWYVCTSGGRTHQLLRKRGSESLVNIDANKLITGFRIRLTGQTDWLRDEGMKQHHIGISHGWQPLVRLSSNITWREQQLDFTFYGNRQYFNGRKCDRNVNLILMLAFPPCFGRNTTHSPPAASFRHRIQMRDAMDGAGGVVVQEK